MKRAFSKIRTLLGASVVAVVACSANAHDDKPADAVGTVSEALASTNPSWVGWGTLGPGVVSDPALFAYDLNYVGALATNGSLWFNWFSALTWGGWIDLGNNGNALTATPVAVTFGNNIEVFVQDTVSGFLLHKEGTFHGHAQPTWSGWDVVWRLTSDGNGGVKDAGAIANLGRPPAVWVSQPNNTINIAASFADGSVKVLSGHPGAWPFWTNLGGISYFQPAGVSWGNSRGDLFAVGTDAAIYHRWTTDNGGTWNGSWENLGGNANSQPSAVSWGPSRLDVFVSGHPTGQISGVQHLAWNGSKWAWDSLHLLAWQDQTHGMAPPVAITTGVGAINVFVQSIDRGLTTMAMTNANGPTWGGFQEISGCGRTGGTPAIASPDGQNLQVLLTGDTTSGGAPVYATSTATDFVATGVNAPPACGTCGYPGSACCWPTSACSDGASCNASTVCACDKGYVQQTQNGHPACVESGKIGEPCNSDGTCNSGNIACSNGKCVESGKVDEPCNPDGTCNPGQIVCRNGQCKASGHVNEPCDPGTHNCDSSTACISYTNGDYNCEAAGAVGQWCHSNGTCDGAKCNPQTQHCDPYGDDGHACTPGGTNNMGICDPGGHVCVNGTCQACGGNNDECCNGFNGSNANGQPGAPCNSGFVCNQKSGFFFGQCQPAPTCGTPGLACCAGNTCPGGGSCVNGQCKSKPAPPPDDPHCGILSVPTNLCCHNKKPACESNQFAKGVCDSTGRCEAVSTSTNNACTNGAAPVAVSICVTDEWGSESYVGQWCSAADATKFYTDWCNGLKTEHGYSQCDVGPPNGACPAARQVQSGAQPGTGGISVNPAD